MPSLGVVRVPGEPARRVCAWNFVVSLPVVPSDHTWKGFCQGHSLGQTAHRGVMGPQSWKTPAQTFPGRRRPVEPLLCPTNAQ